MNTYKPHRFPPDIISYAVWLYYRFNLSHRDIEDLLAERGITVSHESIRLWCIKFGGKQHYLWRAVDQDGEVVDVYLQARGDGAAAKRFFKRLLRSHRGEPRKIETDKLRSYGVAHREEIPEAIHDNSQYANNRVEQSHESTRVRERGMRRFKSIHQAQTFVTAHTAVHNLFSLGRHLVSANHYRNLRISAFKAWLLAVA
jgi:putative transposase